MNVDHYSRYKRPYFPWREKDKMMIKVKNEVSILIFLVIV